MKEIKHPPGFRTDPIYDQLIDAYMELYLHASNSNLDLNDGNIGFATNGVLKIFDMQ